MKKLFTAFVIMLSIACNKEQVTPPAVEEQPQVFYKDDNVSVVDLKVKQTGSRQVSLSFSTEYEKNLQSIEVYSGESMSLLCEIFSQAKNGTSAKVNKYSVVESDIKTTTQYYLIKYTTLKGDWNCSPLYKVELK